MSFGPGARVSPSHLLPTESNLSELLEKLLTVFAVESIVEGRGLPPQHLQRETEDKRRASGIRPMVGNDFHIQPSFSLDPSWKALLQLEQDDDKSDKICLPFCDVTQHSTLDEAAATKLAEQAAQLLRSAWPDAAVGLSTRRQLGLPFVDPNGPDDQLFRWLASKDLNPVSEGVFVTDLHDSWGLLCKFVRQKSRGFAVHALVEADRAPISVDSGQNIHVAEPDAQIWSFTGPDEWVVSLPVLATILLLMTHPTKEAKPLADNPDRDLTWTLDSLHGFCRKEGLEEGDRHLSWSLGTFPDRWMYLNFIFSYFTPDNVDTEGWKGSGMRCDRRTITVPLGGPGGKRTFREQRVWLSMRTATAYQDSRWPDEARLKGPATVGVVLADGCHYAFRMRRKDCGMMEPVRGSSGVTAFQMLLWGGVDQWSESWNACLDYIDRLHQVQLEDIDGSRPETLHNLMFDPDGQLAKEYFIAAHLVKNFRRHIDILPGSLHEMRQRWETTYPGVDSDLTERFDNSTQLTLLQNWSRLVDYADALHDKLVKRIEKMSADLLNRKDSLLIAKGKGK